MAKKNNIQIEKSISLSDVLASGDFSALNPDIQKQVLCYTQDNIKLEVGFLGRLFGTKNTGIHVAFTLCSILLFIIFADMIHSYYKGENANLDFISLIMPFFTLSLGYIFGKGKDD